MLSLPRCTTVYRISRSNFAPLFTLIGLEGAFRLKLLVSQAEAEEKRTYLLQRARARSGAEPVGELAANCAAELVPHKEVENTQHFSLFAEEDAADQNPEVCPC